MEIPYHNTRRGYRVELNNDVWLMVLDNIVSISDLKALCLTSKALRRLATSRLYDTICIPMWNQNKVRTLFESVGCGAGAHLASTRTLVFEDERRPDEPSCSLAGLHAFSSLGCKATPEEENDHAMATIVSLFGKTRQLTTFRFISDRSLPNAVMSNLVNDHCNNLKTLQVTQDSTCDYPSDGDFVSLRHLDLMMAGEDAVLPFYSIAISSKTTLETLSLGCLQTSDYSDLRALISAHLETALDNLAYPPCTLRWTQLNTLKLQYFDLTLIQESLCIIANMSKLSSLSIYNCQGTIRFFTGLAHDASIKPMELKHFVLKMPDDSDEHVSDADITTAKSYLEIIVNSAALKSLHLSWDGRSHLSDYLYSLRPRAPNVSSLSFHDGANHPYDLHGPDDINDAYYRDEVWYNTLHERLGNCPQLQAFGYKIPEYRLNHIVGKLEEVILDEPFMASGLRAIHLRQHNYLPRQQIDKGLFDGPESVSRHTYAFCMQRWANAFFEYLHTRGWCPRLRALVIRSHIYDNKLYAEWGAGLNHYVPQCCYVKGFQTDVFGRTGVVAIPVTRATMRVLEPWADILDYDPECDVAVGRVDQGNDLDNR